MWQLSDWNKKDEKLMLAVEKGQTDRVLRLVTRKRVSPYKIDPKRQITAFHVACLNGRLDVVELILREGNEAINTKDLLGRTALHCAVQKAQHEITKRLLEHGADVPVVDHDHWSVLHHACIGGHLGCVQLLLAKAAPVYLKDKEGRSPLCLAATRGQATICRILLENGADVNDVDNRHRTPLMMAAEHGHTALCEYLLTKGAVPELADKEGHDALWFAVKNNHRDVTKVLQREIHTPVGTQRTRVRPARSKVVEEWPPTADHAYEAVQELTGNGSPKTPSVSSRKPEVTPPGSTTSREKMPLPPLEKPEPEVEVEEEEEEDASHQYSQIDELEAIRAEAKRSRDVCEKMKFSGASFRSFVDEAFGLGNGNGSSASQGRQGSGKDDAAAEQQRPLAAEEEEEEGAVRRPLEVLPENAHKYAFPDRLRKQSVDLERSGEDSRLLRSSLTDVTSAELTPTGFEAESDHVTAVTTAPCDVTVTSADDVTVEPGDVTVAKEIVESLLRDVISSERQRVEMEEVDQARFGPPEVELGGGSAKQLDRGPQISRPEKDSGEGQAEFSGQEMEEGEQRAAAAAAEEDADESFRARSLSPEPDAEDAEDEEEERPVEWPSLSQLIASESDLKELFQHISDLESENSTLRRQLEFVIQERGVMERVKKDVEEKLTLALNRQQWIHEELCHMIQFLRESKRRLNSEVDLAERLCRVDDDLDTLERHLAALVNLRVERIEDVTIYSSQEELRTVGAADPELVPLPVIVARLERENKSLLFQLRQAIRENRHLHVQMEEVERFVSIAKELKDENEALIADYRRFREVQEEEVSEMDDLAQLFRETLEENRELQAENSALKTKVLELQGLIDAQEANVVPLEEAAAEAERLRQENRQLKGEVSELMEAVNRESQTILEMDERLREYNSLAVHPSRDAEAAVRERREMDRTEAAAAAAAAASFDQLDEARRLREMYDELKAQTEVMLKELEEKRSAQEKLERISEDYEDREREIVHLRCVADKKDSDIRWLREEAEELRLSTELVADELKRSHQRQMEETTTELMLLRQENVELRKLIEQTEEKERQEEEQEEEETLLAVEISGLQSKPRDLAETVKVSVDTQVEDGDLVIAHRAAEHQEEEGDHEEPGSQQDLEKAVELTKHLMEENELLRRQLRAQSEEREGQRATAPTRPIDIQEKPPRAEKEAEKEEEGEGSELEKLRSVNRELRREIIGLKRTIEEQSLYLLQMEKNGNDPLTSASPPLQPDQRTTHGGSTSSTGHIKGQVQGHLQGQVEGQSERLLSDGSRSHLLKFRASRQCHVTGNGGEGSLESEGEGEGHLMETGMNGKVQHRKIEGDREGEQEGGVATVRLVPEVSVERSDPKRHLTTMTWRPRMSGGGRDFNEVEARTASDFTAQEMNGATKMRKMRISEVSEEQDEKEEEEREASVLMLKVSEQDAKIKRLEETVEELMSEVERRDELEEECEKIVHDYKTLLGEFGKGKMLFDFEAEGNGSAFGELREWLKKYQANEETHQRLRVEKDSLEAELDLVQKRLEDLEENRKRELDSVSEAKSHLKAEVDKLTEEVERKSEEIARIKESADQMNSAKEDLEKREKELNARVEELSHVSATFPRVEESLRAENETLRCLLQSKSPQLDSDYEEHLLAEMERLTETKEALEKQLKEKDYELEETRDELLEELDILRSKMEAEQKRADRECSEILDDQDQLMDDNKKLLAKITALERDLGDAQEMYDEERVASEKSRELLEEEIERLKAERNRRAEEETDQSSLCESLRRRLEEQEDAVKRVMLEKNQALSQCQTYQINHAEQQKSQRELNDVISRLKRENELLTKTMEREKGGVEEINRGLTERLSELRLENERLIKEVDNLGLILEMEKLKNFSTNGQTTLTSGSAEEVSASKAEVLLASPERGSEDRSDVGLQTESLADTGTDMEEEIQTLRSSNRKLALEVAELHCQLSQKLLPLSDEKATQDSEITQRQETVQRILRDFAKENLRHLQVMAETEERCDQLKREIRRMREEYNHLEQENRTLKEKSSLHPRSSWSDLVEALRQENTKLKEFIAVLEGLMQQKSTLPTPPPFGESPITSPLATTPRSLMKRSYDTTTIITTATTAASTMSRSHDSGFGPGSQLQDHRQEDGGAMVRVFQLQRKLEENDQKYRDIICTYRRHLLSSVQGTIDPEVKAALLRIIDLRHSSSSSTTDPET